ncbi:hypothetical protein [Streptomyces clavifer]|uniref:hypothetical protein n=1 Tax=Streptomyces clavifer TaxID=68188 RepID=UPI0033AF90CE
MRKLQKAGVVVAMLGSLGFIGAGTAFAGDGPSVDVTQSTTCKSHDLNVDILGNVGILNGLLGNALNGEGDPGAQSTKLGSTMDCSNDAF